jgi:hypothetical protein
MPVPASLPLGTISAVDSRGQADCDGHPVARGLKPLIILATTMGHAGANDFKRKIQQNVLRGFMAQTPLDAVHPLVFTDQPELAAEVHQETAKVHGDGLKTVESNFEQVHGFPTLRGMMKQAEAAAIKVGAPFYGYANGDILFTEDLIMTLRLLREGTDDGFFRGGKAHQTTPQSALAKRYTARGRTHEDSISPHTRALSLLLVAYPLVNCLAYSARLCVFSAFFACSHELLQQGMMIIGRRTNFPFSDYVEHLDHENR